MSKDLDRAFDSALNPTKRKYGGSVGLSTTKINADRAGYLWVRLLDNPNEAIRAYNQKVPPIYDLPVEVVFKNNRWEIIGLDDTRYTDWKTNSGLLAPHGASHSAMPDAGGGGDVVWIDTRQFLPFLVMPSGSSGSYNLVVGQSVYRNLDGDFVVAGNTGTPIYPATSPQVMYILMMRDEDGYLYNLTGSQVPSASLTGTSQLLPYLPLIPVDNTDHPLAGVRAGTGTLGWGNLIDLREFFSRSQPNSMLGLIGDIETSPGPGIVTGTITENAVTNLKLADMPALTVKGNKYNFETDPQDLTSLDLTSMGLGSFALDPIDISDQIITGTETHFTFTPAASAILVLVDGVIQKPADVTFVSGASEFDLAWAPALTTHPTNLIVIRAIAPNSFPLGHVIQDTGAGQVQRANLNFVGFTVEDDAGGDATKISPAPTAGTQANLVAIQTRDNSDYIAPTSGSGTEITPLTLTFTPKRAGNLVILEWVISGEGPGFVHNAVFTVTRNGSLLPDSVDGSNSRWSGVSSVPYDTDGASTPIQVVVKIFDFDSLGVESVYRVNIRSSSSVQHTFRLNRAGSSPGADDYETSLSTGMAMEIWQ